MKHEGLMFQCQYKGCNVKYGSKTGLKWHEKTKHGNAVSECKYCKAQLSDRYALKRHLKVMHTLKTALVKSTLRDKHTSNKAGVENSRNEEDETIEKATQRDIQNQLLLDQDLSDSDDEDTRELVEAIDNLSHVNDKGTDQMFIEAR